MITTIQACEERLDYMQPIIKEFDAIVHIDKSRINAYWSFKDMLDIEVDDYRLHLQDDVILADNLKLYLPLVLNFMKKRNVHCLSLFTPTRENFTYEHSIRSRIVPYRNYLCNIGVIFSKYFVDLMKTYIKISSQTIDDDIFINEVSSRSGVKIYAHLPSLIQHNTNISSTIRHNKDPFYSNLFDKNYITNLNLKK